MSRQLLQSAKTAHKNANRLKATVEGELANIKNEWTNEKITREANDRELSEMMTRQVATLQQSLWTVNSTIGIDDRFDAQEGQDEEELTEEATKKRLAHALDASVTFEQTAAVRAEERTQTKASSMKKNSSTAGGATPKRKGTGRELERR